MTDIIAKKDTFTIVRRSANSAAKNDSTLANDDTLLWAVLANEVWHFEGFMLWTGVNTAHDAKYGWSVPAAATMLWGGVVATGLTSVAGYGITVAAGTPLILLTEASTLIVGSAAVTWGSMISGIVRVGANAGTVNLQWAQGTTDAGNLILLKDSFLRLSKLA